MQETFPQLATAIHLTEGVGILTRLPLKTHSTTAATSASFCPFWTQALDPHCFLFFSSALKHQIATKEKKISAHFMDVQMQAGGDGGDNCGVFAIAFATALCCATHLASSSFIRGPFHTTSFGALRGGSLQCSPSTEVGVMKIESSQQRPLLYSAHAECLSFLELK